VLRRYTGIVLSLLGATSMLAPCYGVSGQVVTTSRCGLETLLRTRLEPLLSLMGATVAVVVVLMMVDVSRSELVAWCGLHQQTWARL
jgi:hypothetical protein